MTDTVAPSATLLLRWYDRHRRSMPWRAGPDQTPDPYRVWLSEIMLQQTTVITVRPYFNRFLSRFPRIEDLAAAPVESVMEAWAGLGYYARARNLHACAKAVVALGAFPAGIDGLRALPGIGTYTAAAIASIAFGVPAVPVDGNVERVAARVFAIEAPLPGSKSAIASAAASLGQNAEAKARPADFTQALFDLGATICTPRNPACALCPWQTGCRARLGGDPQRLPAKAPKVRRPLRHGAQFWLEDAAGFVLLRRRASEGLLGGMLELPGTEWRIAPWTVDEAMAEAPQSGSWRKAGTARHGFTHFELHLEVFALQVGSIEAHGLPHAIAELDGLALPRVMRRCVDVVCGRRGGSLAVKRRSA